VETITAYGTALRCTEFCTNYMGRAAKTEESFEAMEIGQLLYLVLFGKLAIRPLNAAEASSQSRETEEFVLGADMGVL
jgi:hypothetical protein